MRRTGKAYRRSRRPAEQPPREEWAHDHGVQPEGRLHPAIWQHIRSFEVYGPLAVPSRVYLAESAYRLLNDDERRALERFRSIGIVRSLGSGPRTLRVHYPDDFPNEKRAPDGVVVSVLVIQPLVTPVVDARSNGRSAPAISTAARDLEARYTQFVHELWRYGISHLDFSILNVGITGSGEAERLQIFDPHMGVIDIAGGGREVQDPIAGARAPIDRGPLAIGAGRQPMGIVAHSGRRHGLARRLRKSAPTDAAEVVREFHDRLRRDRAGTRGLQSRALRPNVGATRSPRHQHGPSCATLDAAPAPALPIAPFHPRSSGARCDLRPRAFCPGDARRAVRSRSFERA